MAGRFGSFVVTAFFLGCLLGCLESLYRIEFGVRYYNMASAATTLVMLALAYGVMGGIYSAVIYLFILANRHVTGHPRDRGHVPYWTASLITTTAGYLTILVFANKWIFTGFGIFSTRGLLYNAVLSTVYWLGALFMMKLITPRLALREIRPGFRPLIAFAVVMVLAVAVVGIRLAGVGSARKAGGTSAKTNLIVISIDTLRRDRVGCFGSGLDTSPQIDRIREESVTFQNAYCEIPITNPSHVSMFTGLTIASHGNDNNGERLDNNTVTLATIMRRKGYRTAAFVSALPLIDRISNLSIGFESYDDNLWVPAWVGDAFFLDALSLLWFRIVHRDEGPLAIAAGEVVERAAAWIDDHAQQPFFIFIHLYDPHAPYAPPAEFEKAYMPASDTDHDVNNALYNGEVRYSDSEIGGLIDQLEGMGLLSRSLLVILSDHGEELGDNEDEYYGHGYDLCQEAIRVPFMLRLPDGRLAGDSRSDFCQVVDLVPTVLPLLGIRAPDVIELDGRDLLSGQATRDKPLFFQAAPRENTIAFGVLDPPWKMTRLYEIDGDRYALRHERMFNLEDDPLETNDLSDEGPEKIVARLQHHLDMYSDQTLARRGSGREKLSEEDIRKLRSLGYLQ
jgi:arylsulfatase A-like enzyme